MHLNHMRLLSFLIDSQLCNREDSVDANLSEINTMVADIDVEPLYVIPRLGTYPNPEYFNNYQVMMNFIKSVQMHDSINVGLSEYVLYMACKSDTYDPEILTVLTHLWIATDFDDRTFIQLISDSDHFINLYNRLRVNNLLNIRLRPRKKPGKPKIDVDFKDDLEKTRVFYDKRKTIT